MNPSLFSSSQIIGYCRSQTRAAFSAHSFISGASATFTHDLDRVLERRHRRVRLDGDLADDERVLQVVGRLDADRLHLAARRRRPAATPSANFASGSNVLPSADTSRRAGVEGVAALRPAGGHGDGLDRHRLVEDEREVVGLAGVLRRRRRTCPASPSKANWRIWPDAVASVVSTTAATGGSAGSSARDGTTHGRAARRPANKQRRIMSPVLVPDLERHPAVGQAADLGDVDRQPAARGDRLDGVVSGVKALFAALGYGTAARWAVGPAAPRRRATPPGSAGR